MRNSCKGLKQRKEDEELIQWLKRRSDGEDLMYRKLRSRLRNSCIGLNQKDKVRNSFKRIKQRREGEELM